MALMCSGFLVVNFLKISFVCLPETRITEIPAVPFAVDRAAIVPEIFSIFLLNKALVFFCGHLPVYVPLLGKLQYRVCDPIENEARRKPSKHRGKHNRHKHEDLFLDRVCWCGIRFLLKEHNNAHNERKNEIRVS